MSLSLSLSLSLEIPLFHVMSARVTFGNINGHTQPVPHVSLKTEEVVESAYTDTISNTGTTVNPIIAVREEIERETEREGEREGSYSIYF